MKNNVLLFDFTVDKSNNMVYVNREFAATLPLVWDAFTKKEILDQWWAPQPWRSQTKFMDFREGGRRFYAMIGPEGEEHWSIEDFTSIHPKSNFAFISAFADKDENINSELPTSKWDLHFTEQDENTKVSISISHNSLADLEKLIEMGFKEGFTMTLNYLDTLLDRLSSNNKP